MKSNSSSDSRRRHGAYLSVASASLTIHFDASRPVRMVRRWPSKYSRKRRMVHKIMKRLRAFVSYSDLSVSEGTGPILNWSGWILWLWLYYRKAFSNIKRLYHTLCVNWSSFRSRIGGDINAFLSVLKVKGYCWWAEWMVQAGFSSGAD